MVDLHHAAAASGALQLRRLAGPRLQAQPRGQGAGRARAVRQAAQAVRLDPRHGVPVGERAVCRRASELAGAETDSETLRRRPGGETMTKTALAIVVAVAAFSGACSSALAEA